MRKFFLALFLALTALTAIPYAKADLEGAPFIPEIDARFNAIEQGNHYQANVFPMGSADGHSARQLAQATYDFSVNGGSSTVNGGLINLGVSLPKNAIITRTYLYSVIKPVSSNGANLEFRCQTVGNIKASTVAAAYAPTGAVVEGAATGASTVFGLTTAACNVSAAIYYGSLTAGKVTAYIEYVVHK